MYGYFRRKDDGTETLLGYTMSNPEGEVNAVIPMVCDDRTKDKMDKIAMDFRENGVDLKCYLLTKEREVEIRDNE